MFLNHLEIEGDVYKRQIQYIEDVNKAGKKLSASILGNKTFVEKVEEETPTPEPQPTPQPTPEPQPQPAPVDPVSPVHPVAPVTPVTPATPTPQPETPVTPAQPATSETKEVATNKPVAVTYHTVSYTHLDVYKRQVKKSFN